MPKVELILSDSSKYLAFLGTRNAFIHRNYLVSLLLRIENIAGEDVVFNDFTILQLRERVNLPTLPILVSSTAEENDIVQIYGYGRVSQGTSSDVNDNEDLVSGETVVRSITNNHIRTGYQNNRSGTCFGDSGGPLVVMRGNQPTLAGVLSGFVELNGQTANCKPRLGLPIHKPTILRAFKLYISSSSKRADV